MARNWLAAQRAPDNNDKARSSTETMALIHHPIEGRRLTVRSVMTGWLPANGLIINNRYLARKAARLAACQAAYLKPARP